MKTGGKNFCYFLIFLFTLLSQLLLGESIEVGQGKPILVNGFLDRYEWEDTSRIILTDSLFIYAKADENYLYLGLKHEGVVHTGLDLYLATGENNRMMLHVSSALAETVYREGEWTDLSWEENRSWTANKIGLFQDEQGQRWSEPEGFEFQFDRELLGSDTFLIAVHFKRPDFYYPSQNDIDQFYNWINVEIVKD